MTFVNSSGYVCAQSCLTLWTVACQAPLSMGFSRQEYWGGLPCPSPGDLPHQGIEPASLASEMCREFGNKDTQKPVTLTPEPHLDLLYTSWDLGYMLVFIFKTDLLSTPEMGENPWGQFASAVSERKPMELIMWANTKVMPGWQVPFEFCEGIKVHRSQRGL